MAARGRGYVVTAQERLARAQARQGRGRAGGAARGRGRSRGRSPMPFDSTAAREAAALGNEGADARASLAGRLSSAENDLGFGAGASNPYSQTAELRSQADSQRRGITNGAGNQLYAGATANAQSSARSEYDKGQKQLEDQYAAEQADFASGMARTGRDEALGIRGIKEGAIERRLATEPKPLGVNGGRAARGRPSAIAEKQNVRRPAVARAMNAKARAINARLGGGRNQGRGRGRI